MQKFSTVSSGLFFFSTGNIAFMPQLITDAFPLDPVPAIRITGNLSASFIAEGGGLGNSQPRFQ